ncbi:hypothetical protein [Ilumatobacter sp.]|uniref:hypothetical protein n=1 Tax=Ilumatobacter sp. TaxID=1967498 RepID=UPI003B52C9E5
MTDNRPDTSRDDQEQAASAVAGDAKDKAAGVHGTAKAEARSVVDDARSQASDVLGTTRAELRDRAAEQTRTLSAALSDAGRQLGGMADGAEEPEAQIAQLTRSAADSLGARAQRLEDGGFDGLVDDVKRFARNRPGAFLLGSVAAGFAIGRLAKHADLQRAGERAKSEFDSDAVTSGQDRSGDQDRSVPSASTAPTAPTASVDADAPLTAPTTTGARDPR